MIAIISDPVQLAYEMHFRDWFFFFYAMYLMTFSFPYKGSGGD